MDLQEQANDEKEFFKEKSGNRQKTKFVKRYIVIEVINYLVDFKILWRNG